MQSQRLRAWKLRLTTSHGSQVWHGCLHGITFWTWGSGLGSSKTLNPTLNTSPEDLFCINLSRLDFMNINLILIMVSWGSKVGTSPPRWDLLAWVGLETWDPMWTGPWNSQHTLNTLSPISFETSVFFGVRSSIPPNGHTLLKYR